MALRPGLVLANPSRLNDETLPAILKQWKVIYSPPMENTDRYDAEYLSKCIGSDWIDMNAFSISPSLVVVDRNQPTLMKATGTGRYGRHTAHASALEAAGRRSALCHAGHPQNRDARTILRLEPFR